MTTGIPVMIHLTRETFLALEGTAQRKGVRMVDLITASLDRHVQARPRRIGGQIPAPARPTGRGWRHLNDAEWAELKKLRVLGWSVAELAVKYGCSSSSIYNRARNEAR